MGRRVQFDVTRGADVRRGDRRLPEQSADVDLSNVHIERFVSPSSHDSSIGEHGWHVYVGNDPVGYVEPQVTTDTRRGSKSVGGWAASGNRYGSYAIGSRSFALDMNNNPEETLRRLAERGPSGGLTRNEAIVNVVRNYRTTGIKRPWVEDDE